MQKTKTIVIFASALTVIFLSGPIQAQNVVRDYVVEKHAVYQPDDALNRGFFYRLQTGHAGLFKHCDDDLSKMHSPYISWHCRPGSPPHPHSDFVRDFGRKLTRFRDGAGPCAIHPTENPTAGFSTYEVVDQEPDTAQAILTRNEVQQLDGQVAHKIKAPLSPAELTQNTNNIPWSAAAANETELKYGEREIQKVVFPKAHDDIISARSEQLRIHRRQR